MKKQTNATNKQKSEPNNLNKETKRYATNRKDKTQKKLNKLQGNATNVMFDSAIDFNFLITQNQLKIEYYSNSCCK